MINENKKIINWPEYNNSLKARGSIEIWVDQKIEDKWYEVRSGERGAQVKYSDFAIQAMLTIGKVFHQRLRQTEGFVKSILKLMKIKVEVADYTTLSRRGERIKVKIPKNEKQTVHIIVDSTGVKVFGDGEWKVRKHGYSKRRTWKKIHIAIDKDQEVRAVRTTNNDTADCDEVENLLNQEEAEIEDFRGDGGYDRKKVYDVTKKRRIKKVIIPPQRNAKIWIHGNTKTQRHQRDENLRGVRKLGRKGWKESSAYHVRSLVETFYYRYKTILGNQMNARKDKRQETEVEISCSILNIMRNVGFPRYKEIKID
jgi:hypothetical protein